MIVFAEANSWPVKAWTDGVLFEEEARKQISNLARLPFVHHHVAVMPDVHAGIGATVGSVIPTVGAIIPAAVGVDIGCGMVAARTSLVANDLPDNLGALRSEIEARVPHGRSLHGGQGDVGAWKDVPPIVNSTWTASFGPEYRSLVDKYPKLAANSVNHLGTLGTGNHFIEICLDEHDAVWIMLHSGSRGVGNRIGSYFIELAREDMRRWFVNLPDKDLAYLPEGTEHFNDYIKAVHWAQTFAAANRNLMLEAIVFAMVFSLRRAFKVTGEIINCHHNYVAKESHFGKNVWLTRKGAVRARPGDLGIIPGSMGARSYIVRGKGNKESFDSCSHGAGRAMSRKEAKRRFTLADHVAATASVECRKDESVLDETPGAYKPIDAVMAAQSDLVEIVHELHQVVCVKG